MNNPQYNTISQARILVQRNPVIETHLTSHNNYLYFLSIYPSIDAVENHPSETLQSLAAESRKPVN